jgi:hypothetical protein
MGDRNDRHLAWVGEVGVHERDRPIGPGDDLGRASPATIP